MRRNRSNFFGAVETGRNRFNRLRSVPRAASKLGDDVETMYDHFYLSIASLDSLELLQASSSSSTGSRQRPDQQEAAAPRQGAEGGISVRMGNSTRKKSVLIRPLPGGARADWEESRDSREAKWTVQVVIRCPMIIPGPPGIPGDTLESIVPVCTGLYRP